MGFTSSVSADIALEATALIFAYAYGRPSAHLLITGPDTFKDFVAQLRAANGLPPAETVEGEVKVLPGPALAQAAEDPGGDN